MLNEALDLISLLGLSIDNFNDVGTLIDTGELL